MADNTKVIDPERSRNANAGDTIATDDIASNSTSVAAGAKVQRVKPGFGGDGEYTDVSEDDPLPVTDPANKTDDRILNAILLQIQLTNLYLSKMHTEMLTESDLDNPIDEGN